MFRGFTLNPFFPPNHYLVREITIYTLSASRFPFEFTINHANSLSVSRVFSQINCLLRDFSLNLLSASRTHYCCQGKPHLLKINNSFRIIRCQPKRSSNHHFGQIILRVIWLTICNRHFRAVTTFSD